MCDGAHAPCRIAFAQAAPRCGAKTREGISCRSPAMPNGRCRMHGGASTGPKTAEGLARSKRSTWRHGHRSAERIALRRMIAESGRRLRDLNALSRMMLRNAGR
ncbi:HGGxSTG domain-containing protein [Methylobacterium thuringiense]|uniref:HGGxSTG domain-containing protein n=1 Tax=Methylobacterium thuringiense TaxID=1003091 RepID=UPI0024B4E41C|nr:HGGxSTG domain-containing protein [Methylobacterium thuringiense]